ncbi:hypothetical protein ACYFX5_15715 [Bremerella sp. T1]|uniref:hypothetical protein n=1 Tax=Bremerella sp. TYQ1 TaxID=3119568 RepID=UPI001CCD1DD9|nr:hypothetical protein [Bremerella volcania]UBM34503.1 hypothetical protein LA756_17665 [Bremerella volcania]
MEKQQVFLAPGTYELASGRRHVFTAQELRKIVSNTLDIQARGYQIPVLLGHPEPGSDAGSPKLEFPLPDASDAYPILGRLEDVWQNEDGGLEFRLNVYDDEAELPEFTSPEIRRRFVLPDGSEVGPVIAHVALTDAPTNTDQQPLEAIPDAVQFSMTNLVETLVDQEVRVRDNLRERIDTARYLPLALRERLHDAVGTVQLSQEAEPVLSLGGLLQMLEETLPAAVTAPATVASHPSGDAFYGEESGQRSRDLARQQLSHAGFLKA